MQFLTPLFVAALAAMAAQAAAARVYSAEALTAVATLAACAYAAWYGYRALRTVYGEPRGRTLAKLGVLALAYAVLLGVAFTGTAAWIVLEA